MIKVGISITTDVINFPTIWEGKKCSFFNKGFIITKTHVDGFFDTDLHEVSDSLKPTKPQAEWVSQSQLTE